MIVKHIICITTCFPKFQQITWHWTCFILVIYHAYTNTHHNEFGYKIWMSSYTHSKDMMGFQNLRSDQRILTKANITGGGFFMGGYNVMWHFPVWSIAHADAVPLSPLLILFMFCCIKCHSTDSHSLLMGWTGQPQKLPLHMGYLDPHLIRATFCCLQDWVLKMLMLLSFMTASLQTSWSPMKHLDCVQKVDCFSLLLLHCVDVCWGISGSSASLQLR